MYLHNICNSYLTHWTTTVDKREDKYRNCDSQLVRLIKVSSSAYLVRRRNQQKEQEIRWILMMVNDKEGVCTYTLGSRGGEKRILFSFLIIRKREKEGDFSSPGVFNAQLQVTKCPSAFITFRNHFIGP